MPVATVLVPGSTSNLGPGFDCLGIALNLYNRIQVEPASRSDPAPRITSPIADDARPGATRLIAAAAEAFFRHTQLPQFAFDIHLTGDVPMARGLGSSVTVRLGTVVALNALAGAHLDRPALFRIVSDLEGHPDNAAPATFGGFTAAAMIDGEARCVSLPVHPRLRFVTLIPSFEVPTEAARRLVPGTFSKADAVHNLTRVGLITAAWARGDLDALRRTFDDRLHQPYRTALIPALPDVLRAGEQAGALGGWLSGSGSTIICLATDHTDAIGRAMLDALPESRVLVLSADPGGYRAEVEPDLPSPVIAD